jgi:hypothetical protein
MPERIRLKLNFMNLFTRYYYFRQKHINSATIQRKICYLFYILILFVTLLQKCEFTLRLRVYTASVSS